MRNSISFTILLILSIAAITAAETKGIKVVPFRDTSGKQVGLYKGSYALVIGVSDYTAGWPKLPSVVSETAEIQAALEKNGFSVRRILNPDEDKLKMEFEQFIDRYGYEPDNRLLVFFSGHGYSRRKGAKGYLVPTDAPDPRKSERDFLRKALPMNQVLAWSRQMEAKHVLFLFDSCFSGTIFKTKALPEVPPHISAITSRPVRQFISAGDAGEEVPAKSVFPRSFLRALRGEADLSKDGYITGSELGMYLHDKVLYYQTGQTPQYGKIRDPDLDEGDFVFPISKPPKSSAIQSSQDIGKDTSSEAKRPSLASIPSPNQTATPVDATIVDIAGKWVHNTTKTVVTLRRTAHGFVVVSAVDDDGEVLQVTHSKWQNGSITFAWKVPSTGYVNSFTSTRLTPNELICSWSGNAGKGVRTFKRQK